MENKNNIPTGCAIFLVAFISICIGICVGRVWVVFAVFIFGAIAFSLIAQRGPTVIDDNKRYRPDGEGGRTLGATEYFTDIAGVTHHNNSCGAFIGTALKQTWNEHDKNAIGIYKASGALVGYIPRVDLESYNEWTDRNELPCIGFIDKKFNGKLRGKVKVIDADRNLTELHLIKFAIWLIENYGRRYIPKQFFVSLSDYTRSEDKWLDLLDEELEKRIIIKKEVDKAIRASMPKESKIITTEEELQGYNIVKEILAGVLDTERVVMKDTRGYLAIICDSNNRKTICRLYFNAKQKYVEVFDEAKVGTRHPIESLSDIYKFADAIKATAKSYL